MGLISRIKSAATRFVSKTLMRVGGLRGALQSGQPGAWATDHAAEAQHVKDWTYIAIRAICLQAAKATVQVYQQRQAGGGKSLYAGESEVGDPLPDTSRIMRLYKRPNPSQSGALFRYECVMNLQATGTCLIWNVPNQAGVTVERYVIPTACAQPRPEGWRVDPGAYAFRFPNVADDGFVQMGTFGQILGKVVPASQVQVIRWPHPLFKDDGMSPISAGASLVATGEEVTKSRWSQLVNGADPSLVVMLGSGIDADQDVLDALTKQLNDRTAGSNNRRKAIVTNGGEGATVTPYGHTPLEMDFGTGFSDYRNAALALQGTPPVAAGIQEAGAYAAYYASLRQFIDLTCQPIFDVLAEEDTEQFLPQFGDGLLCEIEASPIDDPSIIEQQLQTDIQARAVTVDEVRTARGRKPWGGVRGNRIAGDATSPSWMQNEQPTTGAPRPGLFQRPSLNGFATPKPAAPANAPAADTDQAPENVAATQALNGAQINAAKEVLAGVSDGSVAPLVATELLVAVGIAQDRAERMVAEAGKIAPPEPENRIAKHLKSKVNGTP